METKHTHKYLRILIGKKDYWVYKCTLPGCAHYLPIAAALGRESVCWGSSPDCSGRTYITEQNVKVETKRPICPVCQEFKRIQKEMMQTVPMIEGEEFEDEV